MQPEFQQSFLIIFLEVPQILSMIRVPGIPVVCRDGYVVVDVPVNRSDKLQQFTFVVVQTVQKTVESSQAQFVGALHAQCLVRQRMCSASVWVLWNVFPTCRWHSDLEVDFVLLSGGKWPRSSSTAAVVCALLVLLVTLHLVLCSLRLSAGLGCGEVWTVDASVAALALSPCI